MLNLRMNYPAIFRSTVAPMAAYLLGIQLLPGSRQTAFSTGVTQFGWKVADNKLTIHWDAPENAFVNHRRRKEVLFGGAKYYHSRAERAKNLGHAHLIEVQRALEALEGATAVWS